MLNNCCNRTSSYSVYTSIQDLFGDLTLHNDTLPELIASVPQFLGILDSIHDNKLATDAQLLELFGSYILPSYYKSIIDIETFEDIFKQWNSMRFSYNTIGYCTCPDCGYEDRFDFKDVDNFYPKSWFNIGGI